MADNTSPSTTAPLTIYHLTNTFRVDGTGITNVVADLAFSQARAGHRVTVVCASSDHAMRSIAIANGVSVVEGITATSVSGLRRSARLLAVLLKRIPADIAHLHTVRATALLALASPRLFRSRSVSTIHNEYQRSAAVMALSRAVVAVSRADAKSMRRRPPFRLPGVIPNGSVGSPRLPPLSEVEPATLADEAIVFIGALHLRKGVDTLLDAMSSVLARHPAATLYLVGNRDNPSIEEHAARLDLGDRVVFVGFAADPRQYLLAASVFVLPSRAEPFGLVLTEARACGVPIVATSVGGIPEALSGGTAGLLVAPDDPGALSSAIVRVLDDPILAAGLKERGFFDLDRFSVGLMSERYEAVYRALQRPGRRTP